MKCFHGCFYSLYHLLFASRLGWVYVQRDAFHLKWDFQPSEIKNILSALCCTLPKLSWSICCHFPLLEPFGRGSQAFFMHCTAPIQTNGSGQLIYILPIFFNVLLFILPKWLTRKHGKKCCRKHCAGTLRRASAALLIPMQDKDCCYQTEIKTNDSEWDDGGRFPPQTDGEASFPWRKFFLSENKCNDEFVSGFFCRICTWCRFDAAPVR